ncbi:PPE family protein PPE19 [Mycobacterium tuberculosis]|nr:PPE family protein PPE19 [Mycobacterium tuberculosis]
MRRDGFPEFTQLVERPDAFVGWASCCSAWGTLFINWFAAAVSMASSTATACSRSPPGLVISGASSNGSNASVAVAAVAA